MAEVKRVHLLLYRELTEAEEETVRGPVREPPKPRTEKIKLNPQLSGI